MTNGGLHQEDSHLNNSLEAQMALLNSKIESLSEQINSAQDSRLTDLLNGLKSGNFPTMPDAPAPHGWDQIVDPWIDAVPTIGDRIPNAYRIWVTAKRYLDAGDLERSERAERLNYLMHNSFVPAELQFRGEVTFAYGGIGVILHKDADIFEHVTIGANVTVGGNGAQVRLDERTGRPSTVPKIGPLTTIGACANVTGGIELGAMTIVAPNAVVTKSTTPGDIVAGVPAKKIGEITEETALEYQVKFLPARRWSGSEYMTQARAYLDGEY
ncbi:hypothetical protein CGLAR1_02190 [Corynebacterium glutamicum]|uniref:hypothetical protein n=1 Tax=Corynebacterium glutamicum TaxID=1718 RepID=UPI0004F6885E|nr:hypothetical protein [Corynebacterium glutamicum]AIK84095.1 hypothetical protein CGLAR1_02190 [Corynebacterium glutamicum]AIK86857.1 hypothetical protein AR0_02180 [Corynebacterium glutamicum]